MGFFRIILISFIPESKHGKLSFQINKSKMEEDINEGDWVVVHLHVDTISPHILPFSLNVVN